MDKILKLLETLGGKATIEQLAELVKKECPDELPYLSRRLAYHRKWREVDFMKKTKTYVLLKQNIVQKSPEEIAAEEQAAMQNTVTLKQHFFDGKKTRCPLCDERLTIFEKACSMLIEGKQVYVHASCVRKDIKLTAAH